MFRIKTIAAIAVLMLLVKILPAQQVSDISKYCSVDTILSFKDIKGGLSLTPVATYAEGWNRYLFTCYDAYDGSDTIMVACIDLSGYKTEILALRAPGVANWLKGNYRRHFASIGVCSEKIVLGCSRAVLIFEMKDGCWVLVDMVDLGRDFDYFQVLDNGRLLFSRAYIGDRQAASLFVFDLTKRQVTDCISPHVGSAALTLLCREPAVCQEGRILWANNNEYSFIEYDDMLRIIDSVHYDFPDWRPLPDSLEKEARRLKRKRALAGVCDMLMHNNLQNDMIVKQLQIGKDSLLMVRQSHEAMYPLYLDLWVRGNQGWAMAKSDIADAGWTKDIELNMRGHQPLGLSNRRALVTVCGRRIVSLSMDGCLENPNADLTGREYLARQEAYLLKHSPFIQLTIFFYDFDK